MVKPYQSKQPIFMRTGKFEVTIQTNRYILHFKLNVGQQGKNKALTDFFLLNCDQKVHFFLFSEYGKFVKKKKKRVDILYNSLNGPIIKPQLQAPAKLWNMF